MKRSEKISERFFLISILFVVLLFALTNVVILFTSNIPESEMPKEVFIRGYCSVDGGTWLKKDTDKIGRRFKDVRVKGELSEKVGANEFLIYRISNAWLDVYSGGRLIATNRRGDDEYLNKTSGSSIVYIPAGKIAPDRTVEVEIKREGMLVDPDSLDDTVMSYVGSRASLYTMLLRDKTLLIILCLLLSFSGLFSFGIAGFIMGGIDFRYIIFAVTTFFGGLYLLTDVTYSFLPIFISNPAMCVVTDEIVSYAFLISILTFVRTNLSLRAHKITSDLMIVLFGILSLSALVLQLFDIIDLHKFSFYFYTLFLVCGVVLTLFLFAEVKKNPSAKSVLYSWIPIGVAIVFGVVNAAFELTDEKMPMAIGISLTLINQIIRLTIALKDRYYENLRYQQMQKELYEARVSIMVSQIQPHFLYNSLTSIAMLCTKDPKKARNATINFADYLRGNMNSLKEKKPVPFRQELEHLKKYLMLEEMRFGDMLNIEYDIQAENFSLPQLSIQPLVENAVKHGVGMKEDGGTVKISTRETPDSFLVEVADDGVGFDVNKPKRDGRSHVGMENVRARLKEMCNAEVTINSEIGKGTVAVITIPKKNGDDN